MREALAAQANGTANFNNGSIPMPGARSLISIMSTSPNPLFDTPTYLAESKAGGPLTPSEMKWYQPGKAAHLGYS